MFEFVIKKTITPLVLRLGLGVIFMLHGVQKVSAEHDWGAGWDTSGNFHASLQMLVAYSELLGGIAVTIGFLTRLAALGISVIMVGAIATVHAQNGFYLSNGGFEYNLALIIICLAIILLGPGPVSLDRLLFPPRKKTKSPTPQNPSEASTQFRASSSPRGR